MNGTANCQTNTSEWEDDDCEPGQEKRDSGFSDSPGSEPGSKCTRVVTMTYCQVPGIGQLEITEDTVVTEFMVSGAFLLLRLRVIVEIHSLSRFAQALHSITEEAAVTNPVRKKANLPSFVTANL